MDFLQILRSRLKENERELESAQERVRLLTEKIKATKTLIAAEEGDIESSANVPSPAKRPVVSGLIQKLDEGSGDAGMVSAKSTQMLRILEENRGQGISSTDIMEVLKQRDIDIDSSYVYSYLSRKKASGQLTYKDGKYCLVEGS